MLGFVITALCLALASVVCADTSSHTYEHNEKVILWLNKIGPFHNPQETYPYYSLPFCKPDVSDSELAQSAAGIGEVLEGNQLVDSGLQIVFRKDTKSTVTLCSKTLTEEDSEIFKYAVSQHYWYQCYLDDLPIWAMVGEMDAPVEELIELEAHGEKEHAVHDVLVYTHKRLSIAYNGKQIIEVNLTSDEPVKVAPGAKLTFTYEVNWVETDKPFSQRFNRYLDYSFFEHQIHWFSIFNSFMMVIFLCGLVALILVRTLNNDYARFTRGEDDDLIEGGAGVGVGGLGDESGWKQVYGDVFRAPNNLVLLVSCVGAGSQLIAVAFCVIAVAIAGSLYVDRGALMTFVLVIYALTSLVSGYVSGSLYKRYDAAAPSKDRSRWKVAMFFTATLFPGFIVAVASALNVISIYNAAINVVSFGTSVAILLIYLFVSCPLILVGTLLGRNANGGDDSSFPCRINALPRPVPERTCMSHPVTIIAVTGILPFGAVFIEIFFIFSSLWSQKFYYVYGFLLLVLIILIVVTMCVTIVAVYFQLNSEDWRWPWTAFLAAASTSIYVFLYGIYYFWFKTSMTGFLQTNYYFGYLGIFTLALGLMCGSMGFLAAFAFVQRIFRNIKVD